MELSRSRSRSYSNRGFVGDEGLLIAPEGVVVHVDVGEFVEDELEGDSTAPGIIDLEVVTA